MNVNDKAIEDYLESIRTDHAIHWSVQNSSRKEQIIDIFYNRVRAEEISDEKYIRIIVEGDAHSFIMTKDDKMFSAGDILKPKTKSLPDRKRGSFGNILTGGYKVKWTGVSNG